MWLAGSLPSGVACCADGDAVHARPRPRARQVRVEAEGADDVVEEDVVFHAVSAAAAWAGALLEDGTYVDGDAGRIVGGIVEVEVFVGEGADVVG